MDGMQALREFQKRWMSQSFLSQHGGVSWMKFWVWRWAPMRTSRNRLIRTCFWLMCGLYCGAVAIRPKAVARKRANHSRRLTSIPAPTRSPSPIAKSILTAREFAVLHTLALEAGHVVSTDELLNRVWGAEFMGEPQAVYVHMRWLRQRSKKTRRRRAESSRCAAWATS